jgi:UDP-glucose 4-epimerase
MSEILVTGGAGYIGSHVVRALARMNFTPIVYDNLSGGFREAVEGFEFIQGDIGDYDALSRVLGARDIRCVNNFASHIAVGESWPIRQVLRQQRGPHVRPFRAMKEAGVRDFIFSSSAAVYGDPDAGPIREESPLRPASPYGRTKYFIEEALRDLQASGRSAFGEPSLLQRGGADPPERSESGIRLRPISYPRAPRGPRFRLCGNQFGRDTTRRTEPAYGITFM